MRNEKKFGSGGIRTHASEETGALNQRLRPLGHATCLPSCLILLLKKKAPDDNEVHCELPWLSISVSVAQSVSAFDC